MYSGQAAGDRSRTVKDIDTWAGNGFAIILAGLAVAAGVIGMLVAFGQINDDAERPFEDGLIWMAGGIILAIAANVFRREHHVVDANFSGAMGRPLEGGSMGRGYDRPESFGDQPGTGRSEQMQRRPQDTGRGPQDTGSRSSSAGTQSDVRRRYGDVDEPRTRAEDVRDDIEDRGP
jgi:hypothetical protein